jgi:hypothetical protein
MKIAFTFDAVRKTVSILLILAVSIQVSNQLLVACWFTINRMELVERFCVNKQTPKSGCNGSCYLSKKLKEAEDTPQSGSSTPVKHKTTSEEIWFCNETPLKLSVLNEMATLPVHNSFQYSFLFPDKVFQPPRV